MVKKQKIGAIIQARLGSTRLPDKVLFGLPLNSENSILERIISRAEASNVFNLILVATSNQGTDDRLVKVLERKNIAFFRGDETNVLKRYYEAAKSHELDTIVRLTGDNPCIDPAVIKEAVFFHLEGKYDYTKTTGLPLGMNLEVFSFKALEEAYLNASKADEQEHVTLYLYTHPEAFKIGNLAYDFEDNTFKDFRVTVDYPSDYALVNLIYDHFANNPLFSHKDLYDFRKQNPWINEINQGNFQKRSYSNLEEELAEGERILNYYGLVNAAGILMK